MMDEIESLIQGFLTQGGSVFVSAQFNVAWDAEARNGGSCPDFVALDFEKKQPVVVEVTRAHDLGKLFENIRSRDSRWYQPIGKHLAAIGAITPEWHSPRFLGFIREPRLTYARNAFASEADVSFCSIEEAVLDYAYWDARKKGLP
jgi:hypothetical protein